MAQLRIGVVDRFGTAEVGTADLYELALTSEPPLPLGSGNEKSQRIRLGKALGKMRDRVFDIDGTKVRVGVLGVSHQAKRWQLTHEGECGECFPGLSETQSGECLGAEGNVENQHSPAYPIDNKGCGECGECGECFPTLTHARARTPVREDGEKHSPYSPHSPDHEITEGYVGERAGECLKQRPHIPHPPDWLKEVL